MLPEFLPIEIHRRGETESEPEPEIGPVPDTDWQSLPEFVNTACAHNEKDVYRRALERFDRLVVSSVMRQAGGQQNRAAEFSA